MLQVYVTYPLVHHVPISGNTTRVMWVVWKKAKNPSRSSLALKLFLKIFGLNCSDSTFYHEILEIRDLKFFDMLSLQRCLFCSKRYGPNSAASKISMDHARTYPSISRYKGQCFFEVSSLYTCHDQRETPQNCCWNIWNTTQSRFTFNICKVFFTKPCLFCFPPHVGWIFFFIQDQREILQERQLINNPVTWSLMAHKTMNLMTSRKLRVGGSQGVKSMPKNHQNHKGKSIRRHIHTYIYIYIHMSQTLYLSASFLISTFWVNKYRLEIPKMNLHGRSKSRRWIFHLLSSNLYYLIHHSQE